MICKYEVDLAVILSPEISPTLAQRYTVSESGADALRDKAAEQPCGMGGRERPGYQ